MTYAADATPPFYHGTRADLQAGDLLAPGFNSNYVERKLSWIYFSGKLPHWHRGRGDAEPAEDYSPGPEFERALEAAKGEARGLSFEPDDEDAGDDRR